MEISNTNMGSYEMQGVKNIVRIRSNSKIKSGSNTLKTPNPTLDTIQMVEESISKMKECSSKNKLWRSLPKQVQYPTFRKVLEYLANSNKIVFDKQGTMYWIFTDSPKLKKLHQESTILK